MSNDIKTSLVLRIQQSGKVEQKLLHENSKFTVGMRPDNDLTLFGQEYPSRHTLFMRRDGYYQLQIPNFIRDGEIRVNDSVLNLKDLIIHDILPKERDHHVLRLLPSQQGFLTVGDTRIEFLFDRRKVVRNDLPQFQGFSWLNTTARSLYSDLLFKFVFTVLLVLNMTILFLFKDYHVAVKKAMDVKKVQERFARFLNKDADEILREATVGMNANIRENEESSDEGKKRNGEQSTQKSGRAKGSGRGNPAASAGLLSLIGGTGSGSKSSSVVDALVDRGLVADLKSILGGGTNLKVGGKNTKDGIDPLDQLIGTGGSGGIDDFLTAMDDDVEEVTLRKQVRVNLSQATSKSGSQQALGYRTEESVMSMVNARLGRITWLYEKYLKEQPNLNGKVTIEFTIEANGFVSNTRVLESTINHPQLEKDLLNLIRRLKFDPIPEGSATFVFPFHFKKMQ